MVQGLISVIGSAVSPMRTIIIWSGSIASIPEGWLICDGTLSTPDLRDDFVRCVPNAATDPGGTGGSDTHAIVVGEMPQHNHGTTEGTHSHPYGNSGAHRSGSNSVVGTAQSISPTTVGTTGSDTAHENRPAFFQVLFIQKASSSG